MHISVPKDNIMEYVATEISPYVSLVKIKVCYVGQDPNRNRTIITKEVATQMGSKLPGCPIVGYYNENDGDFEEHNRIIEISGGQYRVVDTTKPYGFVAPDAKVWFQTFTDDDGVEREYLCTEGYIWTGAYPESQRVVENGNNQSMELNADSINGTWTNDFNSGKKIFIYSEALIEKLCLLGENFEPCFEGAQVKTEFSLQLNQEMEQLKAAMFALMNEVKDALNKGGPKVEFTTFMVEIGDTLWSALYSYLEATYPRENCDYPCSKYGIRGIFEEGTQKFVIVQDRNDNKLFRLNFVYTEVGLTVDSNMQEVVQSYIPVENYAFSLEDNDNYKKKDDTEGKTGEDDKNNPDNTPKDDKGNGDKEKPEDDDDKKKSKKKDSYSLEEIPEYVELQNKYSELESKYSALEQTNTALTTEITSLREFKQTAERESKQAMIDSFFMLSDEDKKDCVENIDKYSLEDIESKLSVICFRNKVSFAESKPEGDPGVIPTGFSCNQPEQNDDVPEWVKMVRSNQNKEEF